MNSDLREWNPFFLKFVSLLILLAIVALISFLAVGSELSSFLFNVILTAALIFIYSNIEQAEREKAELQKDIIEIQEQQAEIMENQQDLLKAEQQAHIEVGEYRTKEGAIEISLSNYGNGLAKDLQLVTAIDFESDSEIEPIAVGCSLRRAGKEGKRLEQSIRPHQENVWFTAEPKIALKIGKDSDDEINNYGMWTATRILSEKSVDEIWFNHFVRYVDQLGRSKVVQVFPFTRSAQFDEPARYEEIIAKGGLGWSPELLEIDLAEKYNL